MRLKRHHNLATTRKTITSGIITTFSHAFVVQAVAFPVRSRWNRGNPAEWKPLVVQMIIRTISPPFFFSFIVLLSKSSWQYDIIQQHVWALLL